MLAASDEMSDGTEDVCACLYKGICVYPLSRHSASEAPVLLPYYHTTRLLLPLSALGKRGSAVTCALTYCPLTHSLTARYCPLTARLLPATARLLPAYCPLTARLLPAYCPLLLTHSLLASCSLRTHSLS